MKTYLLVFTLLLCVPLITSAQEADPELKHDIGFNTNIILQGILNSDNAPFSLMYKTYNTPNRATRYGINLSLSLNDQDRDVDTSFSEDQHANSVHISLTIGREFQRKIAEKWIWYFGGDFMPGYSSYNTDRFRDDNKMYSNESRTYSLNLRPFLGIRYNVAPKLYLSVEANALLGYNYSTSSEWFDSSMDQLKSDSKNSSINLSMKPASGIFLYYRF